MRREVSIVGGYGKDADWQFSAEDTLNWLPVRSESPGSRTQFMLRQPPGLRPLAEVTDGGPIRGIHDVEGRLYVVSGTVLYELSNALVFIPRGTIPGVGLVSMAHNQRGVGNELAVDNGAARYVLNTATFDFQKVTDEGFPGSFMAFYVDQYIGYVEPQGRYWGHSELADAINYNSLDQYEAEGDPDRIVSAYVSHREVLIFGKETIEPYVNAPSDSSGIAPFQRASNTVIECGCAARYAVAGMDNSVFWPDDKRIIRRMEGYTAVRVSDAATEALLATCTDSEMKRAYAFTWEDRGHKVYYLTVPGKFTIGYDLLSGLFHRRSSPGLNTWRINSLAYWNGQWVGGDMQSGKLYVLDWDYSLDSGEELVRERVTGALSENQARLLISELEVLFSTGGPETVAVEFPGQPDAPTITGNAPAGDVGSAYSYAYTVTGGTPPYVVSLRSGTLPPGLTLSSAGVLSGTPTTAGEYEWTVRATDSTGLYDDLADDALMLAETAFVWFAGPVTVAADSGYYVKANSIAGLMSATPTALPAQGSGALERISVANGKVFMHRATTACMSSDDGATWTACDNSLFGSSWGRDVWWNGTKYYYGTVTSTDGLAWTAIPNLPANGRVQLARSGDGLILAQDNAGVTYTSVDDGATWTTRSDVGTNYVTPMATDGDRICFSSTSNFGYYSDDDMATIAGEYEAPTYGHYYSASTWLKFQTYNGDEGVGVGLVRSTTGSNWPAVPNDPAGMVFFIDGVDLTLEVIGTDGMNWAVCENAAGTATVYASADNGVTWGGVGTLTGSLKSFASVPA